MHRPPHHHLGRPNGLHPHLSTNQPSSSHVHPNLQAAQEQTSGLDKVASASTALDRVMGLLDGFEVSLRVGLGGIEREGGGTEGEGSGGD